MQSSFDETTEIRVIAKCKATFDRPYTAELHDKYSISPPCYCYDGTEASRSNTKLAKDKSTVTKNNPLGECAGATLDEKVVNDFNKITLAPKFLPYTGRMATVSSGRVCERTLLWNTCCWCKVASVLAWCYNLFSQFGSLYSTPRD